MSMFARCLLRGQADEKSGKPYSTVGESTLKASGFLAVFEDEPTLACSANEFYPFLYHWEAGSAWGEGYERHHLLVGHLAGLVSGIPTLTVALSDRFSRPGLPAGPEAMQ
jgi:hypothetical protein